MLVLLAAALTIGPQPPADSGKKDDPIVCRRDNAFSTGSHMRSKPVCRHKSEWEYIERYTEEELRQIDDRRRGMQPRTGMGGRDGGGR